MRPIVLITSLTLVGSVALQADAKAFSAQLISIGSVFVNHAVLPSGTTVYDGDHIAVGSSARALLVTPGGGRVELRGGGAATYGSFAVTLEKGVVGTSALPVELDGQTVEPQSRQGEDAWIVVSLLGGRRVVAVYRGQAWIRQSGSAPLLIPAGSFALQTATAGTGTRLEGPAAEGEAGATPTAGGGAGAGTGAGAGSGPAATAATSGWTIGPLSHAASVALLTAVGATAVGGAIAAVALTGDSPSPSQ